LSKRKPDRGTVRTEKSLESILGNGPFDRQRKGAVRFGFDRAFGEVKPEREVSRV
jgi:hypothetical protein